MTFDKYKKWIVKFFKKKNWYELNSNIRLNFLTEEVGELSQAIRRYEIGRDRPDEKENSKKANKNLIKEELADVFDNIIILMEKYDITFEDMAKAHKKKFIKRYM